MAATLVTFSAMVSATAAPKSPQARVLPAKVAIKGHATVYASHLHPGAIVTLLFTVPDLASHRVERLLGATHADARGNMRVSVSIPLVTTCGPASIYVISAQTAQHLRARFKLTGCKASGKGAAPPAPPAGPSKP